MEINDVGMFHGVLLRFEAASGVPKFCTSATGLTLDQAAALDIRTATADRDWAYAKAFHYAEIRERRNS